uniref:Uncharacterized protein n=1 Tax=viral metagenome TaxID=1070528 RepID=A0A6M3LHU2_9ZZZZ
MPTKIQPVGIAAKSSSLGVNDRVTFINLTKGGKQVIRCNSSGEAVIESFPEQWENGDVISIYVYGRYVKGTSGIIANGGLLVNLGTLSADSSSTLVNL